MGAGWLAGAAHRWGRRLQGIAPRWGRRPAGWLPPVQLPSGGVKLAPPHWGVGPSAGRQGAPGAPHRACAVARLILWTAAAQVPPLPARQPASFCVPGSLRARPSAPGSALAPSPLPCAAENMRREGFELSVSPPRVVLREENGGPGRGCQQSYADRTRGMRTAGGARCPAGLGAAWWFARRIVGAACAPWPGPKKGKPRTCTHPSQRALHASGRSRSRRGLPPPPPTPSQKNQKSTRTHTHPSSAGQRQEPLEEVVCEVEDAHAGEVIEAVTLRKGEASAALLAPCWLPLPL